MPAASVLRRLYLTAVGAALLSALLLTLQPAPEEPAAAEPAPTAAAVPSSPVAWLGEWEGRLAVFREGTAPDEVLDVFVAALPETDRLALEERIPVASEEELAALLQDLSG